MKHKPHPVDAAAWSRDVRDAARREFEDRGKFFPPRAFVLATRDPRTGLRLPRPGVIILVPSEMNDSKDKDAFVAHIAFTVQKSEAVGYVFASEAWMAFPRTEEEARTAHDLAVDGKLTEYADKVEAMMVSFEECGTSRTVTWTARILREGKHVRLAEFTELDGAKGRFTGLMTRAVN